MHCLALKLEQDRSCISLRIPEGWRWTSIGHTTLPMLEVLCKPTLTLFVKNALSILARKNFLESKLLNDRFRPRADIQNTDIIAFQ